MPVAYARTVPTRREILRTAVAAPVAAVAAALPEPATDLSEGRLVLDGIDWIWMPHEEADRKEGRCVGVRITWTHNGSIVQSLHCETA